LHQRLYLRIWLAVVATIAVVTLVAGWLGSQEAERERAQRPGREITIRNQAGDILGQARARPNVVPGQGAEFQVAMNDGSVLLVQFSRPPRPSGVVEAGAPDGLPAGGPRGRMDGPGGPGGRPSPPPRLPFNFAWMMAILAVAVALGTYPIVRRLTKRLESVQEGVRRWGEGDLSTRLPESGNDEVAFLARRFNHSAEQIQSLLNSQQALLASQKSLLANASHELRSPLTRIRMGMELLQLPAGQGSHLTAEISRSIGELDQLIEEILLASRLDAQEADIGSVEAVDLVGLAAEECVRVSADLQVHPVAGKPAPPTALVVQGVGKLLRRALRNLLENARRHGAGDIRVGIGTDGANALIQVSDNGPGVPEAYRERIFEAFLRLPGASERDGGVGLGLALVKSIAARHGGSVRCTAGAQGGACFELRLPLARH
jgi:signal transduction histidine kinase